MSLFESVDDGDAVMFESPPPSGSFERFYRSEWTRTVRLAHLLTGSSAVAEDLAQDAFLRVRRHFDRLDTPQAFLRTATVNVCRNWQRSEQRDRARHLRVVTPNVATPAEFREVLGVVDRLPFRQRSVVVLRYWLDLSDIDIAACLGCRPGTVKSLSARALQRLRQEIPK